MNRWLCHSALRDTSTPGTVDSAPSDSRGTATPSSADSRSCAKGQPIGAAFVGQRPLPPRALTGKHLASPTGFESMLGTKNRRRSFGWRFGSTLERFALDGSNQKGSRKSTPETIFSRSPNAMAKSRPCLPPWRLNKRRRPRHCRLHGARDSPSIDPHSISGARCIGSLAAPT